MDFDSFVLAASTNDLDDATRASDVADAVEFRMDLATDPLHQLEAYDGSLPILATNRAEWEGGEAPDDGRLDALEAAARIPAVEAVDVELVTLETDEGAALAGTLRDAGVAVVASVHDFEGTPPTERLEALLSDATTHGDVGKLAVTAETPRDVLRLLDVTDWFTRAGERVATMAMGEAGRHSRAVAPLYGSKIGYAPVRSADATAPGQYDLATLRELVTALK